MFKRIGNRIIASFIVLITTLIIVLLFLILDHIRDYHLSILKREMLEKITFIYQLCATIATLAQQETAAFALWKFRISVFCRLHV